MLMDVERRESNVYLSLRHIIRRPLRLRHIPSIHLVKLLLHGCHATRLILKKLGL